MADPQRHAAPSDDASARPSRRLLAMLSLAVLALAVAGYWATGSPSLVAAPARRPRRRRRRRRRPRAASGRDGAGADRRRGRPARGADEGAARRRRGLDHARALVHRARPLRRRAARVRAAPPSCSRSNAGAAGRLRRRDRRDQAAPSTTPNRSRSSSARWRSTRSTPKALALAGTARLRPRRLSPRRSRDWQKFADQLPPGSELTPAGAGEHRRSAQARRQARRRHRPPPLAAAGAARQRAGRRRPRSSVSGIVTLDPALAAQAAPGDTRVRLRPRRRAADACRSRCCARSVNDLPLCVHARRQHGDGARHDLVERDAGGRRRAHQQERQCDAAARRPCRRDDRRRAGRERRRGADRPRRRQALARAARSVRRRSALASAQSKAMSTGRAEAAAPALEALEARAAAPPGRPRVRADGSARCRRRTPARRRTTRRSRRRHRHRR